MSEYPELATIFGVPGHNDRWTDDSPDGISARVRHLEEVHRTLERFERTRLTAVEQLDYDLYTDLMRVAAEGSRLGYDPLPFDLGEPHDLRMPLNQMEGLHIALGEQMELAPRDRVQDYDDRIERLHQLPDVIRQQMRLLDQGRAAGFTPCRIAVAGVPDMVRDLAPEDPKDAVVLSVFRDLPSRFGPTEHSRLARAAELAYRDQVRPALLDLYRYLAEVYVPGCRESVGASEQPGGAATYAYLVRRVTTTDLTPPQIHEIGLSEMTRLREEMDGIMRQVGFTGSYAEFKEFVRTDRRFYWTRPEELLTEYRAIAKRIDPELGHLFGRLPRLPYGVIPVPGYREKTSPAAYYIGGAPATGRAGYFYVSTYQVEVRPRWEMEGLTLHEAVPGHHLQIALAQELEHLPEYRRWTGPTAYTEGWGLYAESLGEELGCYHDPYSKFGQLTFDAWRSGRLVVDTGMHALGWSRDRAIAYLRENTAMSELGIAVEVNRYIVWPGQALGYKLGQLKFRELRRAAEQRLGPKFDVRAFHDLILGEGALPLRRVDARTQEWIASLAGS